MTAIKAESSFKLSPATPEERLKVQQIMEIMVGTCDEAQALTVLRRNGGNMDKAMSALFDSAVDDAPTTSGTADYSELRAAAAGVVAPHTPPASQVEKAPVIDLTGEDEDDLSRALKASLQDQGPTFGPSERAPDPNWAMVPSNVAVESSANDYISQDDQDLKQAIEASLNYEMHTDLVEDRPLEDRVRERDSPVALCPSQAAYTYASNIIHALYFIPQVRACVASWRPAPETPAYESEGPDVPVGVMPPTSGPNLIVWTLLETFVNMEYSRMNELCPDKALDACSTDPLTNLNLSPGHLTFEFYTKVTWSVETVLNGDLATMWPEPPQWPRLFHLRHGVEDTPSYRGPFNKEWDKSAVRVTIGSGPDSADLVSCLSAELVKNDCTQRDNIVDTSEVIAFELIRETKPIGERPRFSYPPIVYLDQFLKENAAISTERRKVRKAAMDEIERLQSSKSSLLRHKGRDTLADLRSAVYYFENIAEHGDDIRRSILADTVIKLMKVIARIEEEIRRLDESIEVCKTRAAEALDCPELQKHKYDLRVVLVHDGLYGRNHLYSYVKHKGAWWKTVEYKVAEVPEEEVLSDNAGFHLGAGPYFLIYSRSLSEEEENIQCPWPVYLKDTVKQNNKTFFEHLPDEISAGVVDPNSPPTSYATPMEEIPPDVGPLEVQPMDVDRQDFSA